MTLTAVVLILVIGTCLSLLSEYLNLKHIDPQIPESFQSFYSPDKYKLSQLYLKDTTKISIFKMVISTSFLLMFLRFDGFDILDLWVRSQSSTPLTQGLLYIGSISALGWIFSLPFQLIDTFKIEAKYGFNKTTLKTFILDQIKGICLGVLLGGIVLSGILWFFQSLGNWAWIIAWGAMTLFQLVISFLAPILILPLFNKLTLLPDGELKTAIESYAKENDFHLNGIFTMDSSKRSSKSNAFFTGFGKFRRIVFFDTLIKNHSVEELVAIMAHEVGHYKKRHILKQLIWSIALGGLMFYLLSWVLHTPFIFTDLGMTHMSVYVGLIFFGILYSPISQVFSILGHHLSRKYEFEADAFAIKTFNKPGIMATALKKLSVDNLSNLNPHPLKVFLDYTHPPVLMRIERLY
jgi:STE24 endopeptidase